MFDKFIKYLNDNHSETITKLSETGGYTKDNCFEKERGNEFIIDDLKMIDVDFLACQFPGCRLSSVDGLYVKEIDGITNFYLVEFKKMDLKHASNVDISLNHFKKVVDACEINSIEFNDAYDKCKEYLADETQKGLEIKPLNTLMLLYKMYSQYKAYHSSEQEYPYHVWEDRYTKDYSGDLKIYEDFSNIKYHYIIVYKFEKFSRNKSNTHKRDKNYFKFLEKLIPYPFTSAFSVDSKNFNAILDEFKKDIT